MLILMGVWMGRLPVTRFKESWVWDDTEEKLYRRLLKGCKTVLHLFSGRSSLGTVRVDEKNFPEVTHRVRIKPVEGFRLNFEDASFDAVVADPPWINRYLTWLSKEAFRIARRKVLIITGCFWLEPHKKYAQAWRLKHLYVVKRVSPVVKLVFLYERSHPLL